MSTGAGKGRVPWTELERARDDYIEPEYLPKQVALKQYYHIRQDEANAMIDHWTQRQAAGKVPLRFKKVVKATRQNNGTSEENDADEDPNMGSGDEAENDRQGNYGSQVGGHGVSQGDSSRNGPGQSHDSTVENPSEVGWPLDHGSSRR
jgi:hypothetical protein